MARGLAPGIPAELMGGNRGCPEPTGQARSAGYNLPARYVLHAVVGPHRPGKSQNGDSMLTPALCPCLEMKA